MSKNLIIITLVLLAFTSCRKDDEIMDDPRLKYAGDWNFKGNSYTFSGYYDYSGMTPVWTSNTSSSTSYNDSTGSIRFGKNQNELIIKYCSTCADVVYDLNENYQGSWHINEIDFYNNVQPAPPGYSSYYSTYNIQGWKL